MFMVKILGTEACNESGQMAEEGRGLEEPPEVSGKGGSDLSPAHWDVLPTGPCLEPPVTLAALDRVGNRKGNITSEQRRNQW